MVDRRSSTSWPPVVLGLDAAVLRAALFDHVHAAQQLDARGHRDHHHGRHLVHLVQHAVDAEADHADSRFGSRWMSEARCSKA
jgi:hypothetical protein